MVARKPKKPIPKSVTGDALVESAFRKAVAALRGLNHSERGRVLRAVAAFYQDDGGSYGPGPARARDLED